ncbi:MAG: aspartate carbamoyltransferase regulatory subunit [Oscillospiraceae bacterium]|nr:aspartate carbamoyltransferase regulatory subunit [Oscillospiraceae bacterium]
MIIGQIKNGIVLDHITVGRGMDIYNILHLGELDCTVAMIKNAESQKMGQKDIIKIGQAMDLNLDILGYIDPGITVDIIRDGKRVEKKQLTLPETITDVIRCKNPRCITSVEQGLTHIFRLADPKNKVYRCIYCDSAARR